MLYKFRLSLKLKFTRSTEERRSRDEEDQPSTNAAEQKRPSVDDIELKPIPAGPSKEENDEEPPVEHVRPPPKRRSSSVYSKDSWSSIDCSEYDADIWSRQVEESRIAGLEIVAWWQAVYYLQ
ncbi:hypothetical protein HII31_05758 [Pseudocercospora fuligena]|uniref:Uncharacterized protein n=1 Tax=Pseudocercospora fuligena TaxID=685502 RepID=A0A8H6RL68_9PEZI|nr:hypothetical protein HII31_05758 [Pseudocercospora fuligena]